MSVIKKLLEKQTNPRSSTRIAIFYGPYQKKILTDYSVNMSTGGIFIETDMILPEGTELTVKFKLPHTDNLIVVKAKVAWINSPLELKESTKSPGMGLQFLDLSIKDMHYIQTYLDADKLKP
ncbi:MAG: TIGR02266 family protein, partial [Candidatus Methanomethylicus sp.]|nr:TIGR02266 family protein [Candidatus Methanomethylicus sp.]